MVGATKLEGAGTLEVLALEPDVGPHAPVDGPRCQDGRAVSGPRNPSSGLPDIVWGRERDG